MLIMIPLSNRSRVQIFGNFMDDVAPLHSNFFSFPFSTQIGEIAFDLFRLNAVSTTIEKDYSSHYKRSPKKLILSSVNS
jgi:hypothetical protein